MKTMTHMGYEQFAVGDEIQWDDRSVWRVTRVISATQVKFVKVRWYHRALHHLREWRSGVDYVNPAWLERFV